jgi:pyruvate formate lyase activating enzyme
MTYCTREIQPIYAGQRPGKGGQNVLFRIADPMQNPPMTDDGAKVTTNGWNVREQAALRIAGFERWSTCDWPGELAATVFLQGCPWACPYCHNPNLRAAGAGAMSWAEVVAFLQTRSGLLDAVVFSGGEPLAQAALPAAMRDARALGFRIGLHTGGPSPERFAEVLPLVDWVGFDIKAPFAEYERITKAPGSGEKARESLKRLLQNPVARELRTTVHPSLLDEAAVARLNRDLADLGAENTKIQPYRSVPRSSVRPL